MSTNHSNNRTTMPTRLRIVAFATLVILVTIASLYRSQQLPARSEASPVLREQDDRHARMSHPALAEFMRPSAPIFPSDNSWTSDRELLGRTLFFDPRLSGSNSISCASCHNPGFAWGDGLPLGVGHGTKQVGRRTPTILNLAWAELLFWDGRAESLEEQALGPIAAPGEMCQDLDELDKELNSIAGYRPLFEKAYPGEPVNTKTAAKAIATFERTVVSGNAPFDDWVMGRNEAISASAQRGFALFTGQANCVKCHSGWNFTDDGFHDIGIAGSDIGRGKFLPQIPLMQHAVKTPTLRDVARRSPYMHDGSEKTLYDVIEFYNRGGDVKRPSLSPEIFPLNLSESQKLDLIEFLNTLTGRDQGTVVPALPTP